MTLRPGDPASGTLRSTGRRVSGYYRGPLRNGTHVIDSTPWSPAELRAGRRDPEHMPRPQWIVDIDDPDAPETDPEDEGDTDMASIMQSAAQAVVAGDETIEAATARVAKETKRPRSQVREQLGIRIKAIQDAAAPKAAKKAEPKRLVRRAREDVKPSNSTPSGGKRRKEHAPGEAFRALLDDMGYTNKEATFALKAAGLGGSTTYVYIATHDGSSTELLARWEQALKDYREAHPVGQAEDES